jgi:ABC-2 type transport system ATP-binding protein
LPPSGAAPLANLSFEPPMTKVIETKGLTKIYTRDVIGSEHGRLKISLFNRKVHALRELTLDVEQGEIFGLLGPNGAGKTTTIKILMTLLRPSRGTARLLGKELGDKDAKRQIGFLPENPYFYDYLKGREFLDYYGALYGMSGRKRRQAIPELLARVGLDDRAADLPLRGYSKGMLQRIGIAQALLNNPRLIILDEPQSGLDPLGRKEVRDIILDLKREGRTVLFSSHILSDAELICDRVGILNRGNLLQVGAMSELLSTKVKEIEVTVAGLAPVRVEEFRSKAKRFLRQGDETLFVVASQELADDIVRAAIASQKGRIVAVTPRKETLEEYFIGKVAPGRDNGGKEAA